MNNLVIAILLACMTITCSNDNGTHIAGGATETVNAQVIISDTTVTVRIKSDTSVAMRIVLCDSAYDPVNKKGYTDSVTMSGQELQQAFHVKPGKYNTMIFDKNSGKCVAFMSMNVFVSQRDTLSDSLSEGNDLSGSIIMPDGVDLKTDKVAVYFEGTTIAQMLTEPYFLFVNIPDGKYRLTALISNPVENGIKSLPVTVTRHIDITGKESLNDIQLIFSR